MHRLSQSLPKSPGCRLLPPCSVLLTCSPNPSPMSLGSLGSLGSVHQPCYASLLNEADSCRCGVLVPKTENGCLTPCDLLCLDSRSSWWLQDTCLCQEVGEERGLSGHNSRVSKNSLPHCPFPPLETLPNSSPRAANMIPPDCKWEYCPLKPLCS